MPSSASALQSAIAAHLATHAPLVTLLGANRVFDQIPNPPPYPYITLGQSTSREDDSDTSPADRHTITLQVWSRARGRTETHSILDAIRTALHDQTLTLTQHRLINLRHDFTETRRDNDGITFRGLIRFRALTEPL